ncbi:ATP-binding cassette domain-containing protein [Peribacillus cavernae]|uniref:ATP-binding cassette domain-containing protein n=1 Tax=Peribacillus cavernae TaxID=1674310 RepID=A0A3S0U0I0_9BACI|nr:oligopeptide/dipeptide ABC transporter ATP-binding protein [Peribacillus cavernae]MDQ0218572.1 oligopeptide/dipeptide ABC transporter ATP-binding protein [Peribacillus cavernae]RUQ31561.1 ATP-binding cassette domain-containing protein [Peribacillus cavernae]
MSEKEKLIEVKNLKKYFNVGKGKILKAVDDVSFDIYKGETLGLVGESGCGKSTAGRTIIQLYNATSGQVIYDGEDTQVKKSAVDKKSMKKKMQMIYQDPYSSLNPRMTVLEIIAEGIGNHEVQLKSKEKEARVYDLLESVGLNKKHANRYPHEFSGGQCQRIGIARALAVAPEFIIADEPIAALDVSIQAQIVNLLQELQQKKGLTYLFIAHDLSMVKHISDRIAVMYLGGVVELAGSEDLYDNPLHPYTQALLSAIPIPDPKIERTRERIILKGDVPNPMDPPSGCRFRTRCPKAMQICTEIVPEWQEVSSNHFVACHLYKQ